MTELQAISHTEQTDALRLEFWTWWRPQEQMLRDIGTPEDRITETTIAQWNNYRVARGRKPIFKMENQ